MRILARGAVIVALLACGCGGDGTEATDGGRPLTLALEFMPNAAHAGVYAAAREGQDRRRGVALEIRAPSTSTDSLKLLASGAVDLAIADIHDLGLARERGEDLVGVGAVVQRPLAAVIARGDLGRPRDLEGERVGVTGLPSDEAVLRAVVEDDGGEDRLVDRVTIGFSAVPSLIESKVDAATAFWNAEGVTLRRRGVPTTEFRVEDHGAPAYPELVLVARSETVASEPELLRDALAALAAGTESVVRDPEPAVVEIAEVSGADEELVRAQLEALRPALTPAIELDRRALERWAAFDERFGILERRPDPRRAFALDLGDGG